MTRATPILRQPHRRRSNAEWDEIKRLYQAGATAKALVKEYGGTERTQYARARRDGWRRKDDPAAAPHEGLTPREADEAVRELGAGDPVSAADAACRALAQDASLGDAARAAATTAIAHLRDLAPARSYTYARLAGTLERLARGAVGDGGADAPDAGREAALDCLRRALREEAACDGRPSTPSGSARPAGSADRSSTPSLRDREETRGPAHG